MPFVLDGIRERGQRLRGDGEVQAGVLPIRGVQRVVDDRVETSEGLVERRIVGVRHAVVFERDRIIVMMDAVSPMVGVHRAEHHPTGLAGGNQRL